MKYLIEVKRLWSVFVAHVRCNLYCLRWMSNSSCVFTTYGYKGQTQIICAITGCLGDKSLRVQKVFYNTSGIENSTMVAPGHKPDTFAQVKEHGKGNALYMQLTSTHVEAGSSYGDSLNFAVAEMAAKGWTFDQQGPGWVYIGVKNRENHGHS